MPAWNESAQSRLSRPEASDGACGEAIDEFGGQRSFARSAADVYRAPALETRRASADRSQLGARDQVRRISDGCEDRAWSGEIADSIRARLVREISGDGSSA